jgi:hypothetical protein
MVKNSAQIPALRFALEKRIALDRDRTPGAMKTRTTTTSRIREKTPDGSSPLSDGWLTGTPKQPPFKNLSVFAFLPTATSTTTNGCKGLTGQMSRNINVSKGVDGVTGKIPQGPPPLLAPRRSQTKAGPFKVQGSRFKVRSLARSLTVHLSAFQHFSISAFSVYA